MTLERQTEVQHSGTHVLLLTAYLVASAVGLISALFAPWFKWEFLLIGVTAMAGVVTVIKSNQKHVAARQESVYGQSRAVHDRLWVMFIPLMVLIVVASWKVLAVLNSLLLG